MVMPDREYRTGWLWAAVIVWDVLLIGAFGLMVGPL